VKAFDSARTAALAWPSRAPPAEPRSRPASSSADRAGRRSLARHRTRDLGLLTRTRRGIWPRRSSPRRARWRASANRSLGRHRRRDRAPGGARACPRGRGHRRGGGSAPQAVVLLPGPRRHAGRDRRGARLIGRRPGGGRPACADGRALRDGRDLPRARGVRRGGRASRARAPPLRRPARRGRRVPQRRRDGRRELDLHGVPPLDHGTARSGGGGRPGDVADRRAPRPPVRDGLQPVRGGVPDVPQAGERRRWNTRSD
jgi:hypothetical protein